MARLRGRMASRAGDHAEADESFKAAEVTLRDISDPFWVAVSALQHGEPLVAAAHSSEAEPVFEEARDIFAGLGAEPWLRRLDQARQDSSVGVVPA